MQEPPRDEVPQPVTEEDDLPPPVVLPRWVPILIGLILVGMAALALYTGLRYRDQPFKSRITPPPAKAKAQREVGAPGEPTAGASRMMHGEYGENAPQPNAPVAGEGAKVQITGGSNAGISHTVRVAARRGVLIDVQPDDAQVYINDNSVGIARQFKDPNEIYEFPDEGSFTIRIIAPGHRELTYVVTATQDAPLEIVEIRGRMDPQ